MLVPKYNKFVLSLSFGNYLKGDGGTDKVISEHQKMFYKNEISYVQIAPVKNKKIRFKDRYYSVVIDEVFFKVMHEEELLSYLNKLNDNKYYHLGIFIHHLLKFENRFIEYLCDITMCPLFFMIHDFYSVCVQYKLYKNDKMYCGEEKPNEKKCKDCKYFEENMKHINYMKKFFEKYKSRMVVISPSESALNIWNNTYKDIDMVSKVISHQNLAGNYQKKNKLDELIKIAYIGKLNFAKGSEMWDCFQRKLDDIDNKYKSYYLGISENIYSNVEKVNIFVNKDNPNAMIDALRKLKINIVLLWSTWPETYSYTFFEALASGCYVITNSDSGNIAAMVKKYKNGKIFNSIEQAMEYLKDIKVVRDDIFNYLNEDYFAPKCLEQNDQIINLINEQEKYSFEISEIKDMRRYHLKSWIINFIYSKKNL